MKLLVATHNKAKLGRYRQLVKDIPYLECISLADIGVTQKIPEPFSTAKENAIYKAKEYAKLSGLPTLAIDEATTTNFLPENEQPGVYVRRFANSDKEMTDAEQREYWKIIIANNPQENKQFEWEYSIAYYHPQKDILRYHKSSTISIVTEHFSDEIMPGYPMASFLILGNVHKPYSELREEERMMVDKEIFSEFIKDAETWMTANE